MLHDVFDLRVEIRIGSEQRRSLFFQQAQTGERGMTWEWAFHTTLISKFNPAPGKDPLDVLLLVLRNNLLKFKQRQIVWKKKHYRYFLNTHIIITSVGVFYVSACSARTLTWSIDTDSSTGCWIGQIINNNRFSKQRSLQIQHSSATSGNTHWLKEHKAFHKKN